MGVCNTFPAEADASSGPGTTLGEHCCPLSGGGGAGYAPWEGGTASEEREAWTVKKEIKDRIKMEFSGNWGHPGRSAWVNFEN